MAKATAAAAVRTYNSAAAEPFANGSTASYVEEMYNAWLRDPTSVHTVSESGFWEVNKPDLHYETNLHTCFQFRIIKYLLFKCLLISSFRF